MRALFPKSSSSESACEVWESLWASVLLTRPSFLRASHFLLGCLKVYNQLTVPLFRVCCIWGAKCYETSYTLAREMATWVWSTGWEWMPRVTRVEPMPRGSEETSMSSMGCSVHVFCRRTRYVHFHSFLWSLPPWPPWQLVPSCPFHLGNFGLSPKVMSHGSSQPLLQFLQIPRVVSISSAVSTVSILQSISLDWKCDLFVHFP